MMFDLGPLHPHHSTDKIVGNYKSYTPCNLQIWEPRISLKILFIKVSASPALYYVHYEYNPLLHFSLFYTSADVNPW